MAGTYEEHLESKGWGKFKVTEDSWLIQYYFGGPDMRYNGTWVTIQGDDIDSYINAYKANWAEYQSLKTKIPEGGTFRKDGENWMSINVGSSGIYSDGVCIDGWHMPINDFDELQELINSFEYCKSKAPEIMRWLKNN